METELDLMQQEQADVSIDLSPPDLERLVNQVQLMYRKAEADMRNIHSKANEAERSYNLEPYQNDQLPFRDALSIRIPTAQTRVDLVAGELAGAFDKNGAPIFVASPNSASTHECAAHVTQFLHQILTKTGAMTEYRKAIKRALKVGIGIVAVEAVSKFVGNSKLKSLGIEEEYENELQVRCVKIQDMYFTPVSVPSLARAAFVGERFRLMRWELEESLANGFYSLPENYTPSYGNVSLGGKAEDFRRVGVSAGSGSNDGTASDEIDLIKAWVRFTPEGEQSPQLYHVVFPANDTSKILRCKVNPYEYLDEPPYTAWQVDEGDGTIFGRSYMALLADLSQMLDTYQMLRVEQGKRGYSNLWGINESSPAWALLEQRRNERDVPDVYNDTKAPASQGAVRIYPDEVLPINTPNDIISIPLSQSNPNFVIDEQRIAGYMDDATIPTAPLQGIRSAIEVSQSTGRVAAKLKTYLSVLSATGMTPHIKQVVAQAWQYMMFQGELGDGIRFMQYGDMLKPVTMSDFFLGLSYSPVGTTTSADRAVKMTVTGDLMNQVVPMLMQIPGLSADPIAAVREIVKQRLEALGAESTEQILGLTPPSEADVQKQAEYMKALAMIGYAPAAPQNAVGGDGGIGLGLQDQPQAKDRSGGAATGIQENKSL